jgi:hypothetical protein
VGGERGPVMRSSRRSNIRRTLQRRDEVDNWLELKPERNQTGLGASYRFKPTAQPPSSGSLQATLLRCHSPSWQLRAPRRTRLDVKAAAQLGRSWQQLQRRRLRQQRHQHH